MINFFKRFISNQVPKMSATSIKFSNGYSCPILGLGTWKSAPGEVEQAVKDSIDAGYRHFDCAYLYGNEDEIGNGIEAKVKEGVVKREDLFVTSKLWNTFLEPQYVRTYCEKSLKSLKLKYLDLYLIHWPMGYKFDGDNLTPKNEKGEWLFSDVDYIDTWKEMEKLVDDGLVKSIGISNFNSQQVDRLLNNARIKPVTNQVESHPYLNQKKLIDFCKNRDIVITAYSPLGSNDRPWVKPDDPSLMEDPKIVKIAQKHNKTPAQILIRYQIERNVIVIPKSVTKSRIIANFNVFDFKLDADDIKLIDSIDCNGRICPMEWTETHPHYPFHIEF